MKRVNSIYSCGCCGFVAFNSNEPFLGLLKEMTTAESARDRNHEDEDALKFKLV